MKPSRICSTRVKWLEHEFLSYYTLSNFPQVTCRFLHPLHPPHSAPPRDVRFGPLVAQLVPQLVGDHPAEAREKVAPVQQLRRRRVNPRQLTCRRRGPDAGGQTGVTGCLADGRGGDASATKAIWMSGGCHSRGYLILFWAGIRQLTVNGNEA